MTLVGLILALYRRYNPERRFAMLVDKEQRTPTDLTRVNLEEDWEVQYWCERFATTEAQLRACVLKAGPHVADIEQRLKKAQKEALKNTGED